MLDLTPAERRGALWIGVLFLLGAGHDLWSVRHPRWTPPPRPESAPASGAAAGAPYAAEPGPPSRGAPTGATVSADSIRGGPTSERPLDLNRATEADLDRLPGIGPVLARRIVERRRELGGFRRVEDLRSVRGIGPRLFARLSPKVGVLP